MLEQLGLPGKAVPAVPVHSQEVRKLLGLQVPHHLFPALFQGGQFVLAVRAVVQQGEQVILQQVGGREAHAAGIERFEDRVGVQLVTDGDDGEEQPVTEVFHQLGDACAGSITGYGFCSEAPGLGFQIVPDFAVEPLECLAQQVLGSAKASLA